MLSCIPALGGCNGFFVCQKASCPASSSSSSSGSYGYAINSSLGASYISGYVVSSGSLVTATSSPYSTSGYSPLGIVVLPGNSYLYAAATPASGGGIYGYSIGTGGALTVLNSGSELVNESSIGIDVTPDGDYLYSLNSTYTTLQEYKIVSGGLLQYVTQVNTNFSTVSSAAGETASVKVSPNNNFVAVAVAGQGTEVFSLSSGNLSSTSATDVTSSGSYAIAIDSSNYLYVLNNASMSLYSVSSSGAVTSGNTYAVGTTGSIASTDSALTISTGNAYIYAAWQGNIYGFSGVGSGSLTATSPASVTGPTDVSALGRDSSGDYLMAAGYSSTSGLQLFSIGSSGGLTEVNNVANGTTAPNSIAFTH